MEKMGKGKTVIIGLDGAPFDKIRQLVSEGRLPHIKRLIETGSFGCLESSFLPTSPVAWSSIFTGRNPGEHGVYDWGYREENGYDVKSVNSSIVDAPLLWDILNAKGKTTGIFNVPVTYPPRPVDGFLVCGFDTPGTKVSFTYPEDLFEHIGMKKQDYPLISDEVYMPGREKLFVDGLKRSIKKKKEVIFRLLDNYDLDFYVFVLMELDHLHHKMWNCFGAGEKKGYIYDVYESMDETVGAIIERFPEGTDIFVVSDHGAGELDGIMYINNWLYELGLLNIKRNPLNIFKKLMEIGDVIPKLYGFCSRVGLGKLARLLPRSVQYLAATSFFSLNDVDWSCTKAYSFGEYGQIYVNLKGREPDGIIAAGDEYEKLVDFIISRLKELADPDTREKVITKIFRKNEIYSGKHIDRAPDILFEIRGHSYDSSVKFGFRSRKIFDKPEFSDSGTHRREGTVIMTGRNVKEGYSLGTVSILDIMPTLLYSMGLGIPCGLEGKVLGGCFSEEFAANNPPKFEHASFLKEKDRKDLSALDEEQIKRKLKGLGYMS